MISPRGDTHLLPGDEVLAVLHSQAQPAVAALLGPAAR
jgi:Trk K+ transport system NAD-binding subunit